MKGARVRGSALLGSYLALAALPLAARAAPAAVDPERGRAWNAVLVWDAPAVSAINLGLGQEALDPAMRILSHRALLVGAPLAALPYVALDRDAGAALETGLTLGAAEAAAALASFGLKDLFGRPRPYVVDPALRLPDGTEDSAALPSGHAAVAFAWAAVLANDEPALAWPAYLAAGAIGFSRMYLGVHYPTDVLAGAALGLASGQAVLAGREAMRRAGWIPARAPGGAVAAPPVASLSF